MRRRFISTETNGKKINLRGRQAATLVFGCAFIAGMLAGCHRGAAGSSEVQILTQVEPQPPRVGKEEVTVRLTRSRGEQVVAAHVRIEADMDHPGMAPVFADTQEQHPGIYVAQIDLNMPGDWVLLEHVRLADGKQIEHQTNLKGVLQP
jgi:hypothetical protein